MRFVHLTGAVSCFLLAAACSGTTTEHPQTSGTGGEGAGGAATTTTTTASSSSSSSGTGGTGGTLDNGHPSDVYPAPHPAPPKVVSYGGPVLASPRLVPVFFSNDDANFTAQLLDFDTKIGATNYWMANAKEYGVGAATATDAVNLAETAPGTIDDSAIQTWLEGKLNGDDPAWPAPDANTVYVLHYPAGTTITSQGAMGTDQSCVSFGGYHSNVTLDGNHGGMNVAYAVIPRCSDFDGLTGVDAVTSAESHELLEAATDPYPMVDPAYASTDDAHIYWLFALGGGETGDMCAQDMASFTKFAELPYTVQRTWSNEAAQAGHDPCVPAIPGEVYFNSAPVLDDKVTLNIQGQTVSMKGVKIPVGSSKTIDLDLFSDGPTNGPWQVEVHDYAELLGQAPKMDFALDRDQGQNGEKLHLTITVNKASTYHSQIFFVFSKLGDKTTTWVGLVGN
jgi:hypothetical protein